VLLRGQAVMSSAEQPERGPEEPMPLVPGRPELALVPSSEHLLRLRGEAKQNGTLTNLRQMVAAWQAVAEKCNLAFEEMTRLAIYRLEVERDLGAHLTQQVQHGGDRSRYARRTLLPDDITKNQCSAYKRLAAIPEDVFRAYLADAHGKDRVPSSRGARAFAASAGQKTPATKTPKKKKRGRSAAQEAAIPAEVLECLAGFMTLDVIVGDADVPSKKRVAADSKVAIEQLRGDVLVAQCPDPARWLGAIEQARRETRVSRAIVVLPAATLPEWIVGMEHGDWLLCCLRNVRDSSGHAVMLAHIGERPSVFRLAFWSLGVVLRAATAG